MKVIVETTRRYSCLVVSPFAVDEVTKTHATAATLETLSGMSLHPINVSCFFRSFGYFDNDEEGENITEETVGQLKIYSLNDSLLNVRAELYKQIPQDRLPLRFSFANMHDAGLRPKESVLWFETVPTNQESDVLLGEYLRENAIIHISAPVSILHSDKTSTNPSKTLEENRVAWDHERQALIMEIRALEERLAEVMQHDEITSETSLLRRSLFSLRKEGFISTSTNLDSLEEEYLHTFSKHDSELLFSSNDSNPFRFVWRRMAENPTAIRRYLESLQAVLVKYRIRTLRLISRFWTRVLRDMRFLKDPDLFATWATSQPWTLDEAERAAYLGSLVLSDTVGQDAYLLVQDPIPYSTSIAAVEQNTEIPHLKHGKPESIAEAAERLHVRTLEKHELRSHKLSTVDRSRILLDHPCDHFDVDILAAQFGVCICGFPRSEHNILSDDKPSGVLIPPAKLKLADKACLHFEIDILSNSDKTCKCGFLKADHVAVIESGQRSRIVNETRIPKQPRPSFDPCEKYEIDLGASRYGVCLCGHDRKAHGRKHIEIDSVEDQFALKTAPQDVEDETDSKHMTSSLRALNAVRWIEAEISRLISRIEQMGRLDTSSGNFEISFGDLFIRYQNVSDTLVGVLVRAKRKGLIAYTGGYGNELLLQGAHDNVLIVLLKSEADKWRISHPIT